MPIRDTAKAAMPDWNERVLTDIDYFDCCDKKGFIYIETNLIESKGEFLTHRGKDFILVHPDSPEPYKPWIKFHELGHALLHQPGKFSTALCRRFDYEANVFATVALLPVILFEKYSFEEIEYFYNYPPELIDYRLMVYEKLRF